ncbi:MAG TPA: flagellar biosynthesis [Firmicutes bacterium]|nr:flagellar biosynthesis [Bacillota bacterium]
MKKAAALRYRPAENKAPQILASGRGLLAERIIEEAAKSGVPLFKQKELAEALAALPAGLEIPPELYELTAGIFAFILRLDQEKSGGKSGQGNG